MSKTTLGLLLVAAVACGTRGSGPKTIPAEGGDGSATEGGASESDAGDFEMFGVYRCCAPGAGTRCCAGTPSGTCFESGGIYGRCRNEGESFEAKSTCARCCDGLEALDTASTPGNAVPSQDDGLPDGCDFAGLDSVKICGACGDGKCGPGESFCNCPRDCSR